MGLYHLKTLVAGTAWACALLSVRVCSAGVVRINSFSDFLNFARDTSATSGSTVLLDSDLDLSTLIDSVNDFSGTFDGQGHVISNLTLSRPNVDLALFNQISEGAVIKNVVLDRSCSVRSSTDVDSTYVSGLVSSCTATKSKCAVLNTVSMATTVITGTFYEDESTGHETVYGGGIIGMCSAENYECLVRNTVNYGSVVFDGQGGSACVGGLVGHCDSSPRNPCFVQNSLNYGSVVVNASSVSDVTAGGMLGLGYRTTIEGCANLGSIIVPQLKSGDVGAVFGYIEQESVVKDSYYLIESCENGYGNGPVDKISIVAFGADLRLGGGSGSSSSSSSDGNANKRSSSSLSTNSDDSESGSGSYFDYGDYFTVVDALNNYVANHSELALMSWVMNKRNVPVSFRINGNLLGTFDSEVILLPSLEREGFFAFEGWYVDESLTVPLLDSRIRSKNSVTLYGHWNESYTMGTVFFETDGGCTVSPITARAGTVISLPKDATKKGYMFVKWVDSLGFSADNEFAIPSQNVTLHAQWAITDISSVEDFVEFARNVNDLKMGYDGVTVTLSDDIDMSSASTFEPVADYTVSFDGVFDGRGYSIKNLVVDGDYGCAGILGNSYYGAEVRNVVVDSSCSFTVSDPYACGAVFARCMANERGCYVSNSVNMASISLAVSESTSDISVGGIMGACVAYEEACNIKNCANYGSVTVRGTYLYVNIGGIIGLVDNNGYSVESFMANNFNHGPVSIYGTSDSTSCIGGVVGYFNNGLLENTVNVGKVTAPSTNKFATGAIYGGEMNLDADGCFWSSNGAASSVSQDSASLFDDNFVLEASISTSYYSGNSLIEALNAYAVTKEMPEWVLNKASNTVQFVVGGKNSISYNSQLILFPDLVSSNSSVLFNAWYTGPAMTLPLSVRSISSDTTLYGFWDASVGEKNYTISFVSNGGNDVPPMSAPGGSTVTLPVPQREGYVFIGWVDISNALIRGTMVIPVKNVVLRARWMSTVISTAEEYLDFVYGVNSGESCEGLTIKLANDIDLQGHSNIGQMGQTEAQQFSGTFDGQGYAIKNLNMSGNRRYVSLFGIASVGITLRNVVLDKSCTFASTAIGVSYVTGMVASCTAKKYPCVVENSVNMAPISWQSMLSDNLVYLSGLVGYIYGINYLVTVRNCVNYGTITAKGSVDETHAGGIIVYMRTSSLGDLTGSIRNCANFGKITLDVTAVDIYNVIGGIVVSPSTGTVSNCVNHAKIECPQDNKFYVGTISGSSSNNTLFENCFWDTTAANGLKWSSDLVDNITFKTENVVGYSSYTLSEDVTVGEYKGDALLDALNAYVDKYSNWGLSKWVRNPNARVIKFAINEVARSTSFSSGLIMLPSPANYLNAERMYFGGWYTDANATKPLSNYVLKQSMTLYGLWVKNNEIYTIFFNVGAGEPMDPISGYYGTPVDLKDPKPTGDKSFAMWVDEYGAKVDKTNFTIPAYNMTLRAIWIITRITTAEDFSVFAETVDAGVRYQGMTVALANDLDLSSLCEGGMQPINRFRGTFEGNGHIISGLNFSFNGTNDCMGLFGESYEGTVVRNLIVDASISVISLPSMSSSAHVGSIIGSLSGSEEDEVCAVQNCLAMGSIRVSIKEMNVHIGGIAGSVSGPKLSVALVESCVSYMSINVTGAFNDIYIGGIVGKCDLCTIRNCMNAMSLNYVGTPYYNAAFFFAHIGGIAGSIQSSSVISSVSFTTIDQKISSKNASVGSIVGSVDNSGSITQCYWSKDSQYGITPSTKATVTASYPFDSNLEMSGKMSIVTDLNTYATKEKLSTWTLLEFYTFDVVDVPPVLVFSKHFDMMVLPLPALPQPSEELEFNGWFMDKDLKTPFDAGLVKGGKVTVYARWKEYSNVVKVDYNIAVINDEEVVTVIKRFLDCEDCFTVIEKFDDSGSGSMTIYFRDIPTARRFVDQVTNDSGFSVDGIKSVAYLIKYSFDLSSAVVPAHFCLLALVLLVFHCLTTLSFTF